VGVLGGGDESTAGRLIDHSWACIAKSPRFLVVLLHSQCLTVASEQVFVVPNGQALTGDVPRRGATSRRGIELTYTPHLSFRQ
jgi:hypothetical protein